MTQNLILTSVEKPSRLTLQKAIRCFDEDAPENSVDQLLNASLDIIGEACSLLSEGKTKAETIASLKRAGLSEGCSTPLVEKAISLVHDDQQFIYLDAVSPYLWPFLIGCVVLLLTVVAVVVGSL